MQISSCYLGEFLDFLEPLCHHWSVFPDEAHPSSHLCYANGSRAPWRTWLERVFCCMWVCQRLSQPGLKTLHANSGLLLAEYVKVELQATVGSIIADCINSDVTTECAVCYSGFIKIKRWNAKLKKNERDYHDSRWNINSRIQRAPEEHNSSFNKISPFIKHLNRKGKEGRISICHIRKIAFKWYVSQEFIWGISSSPRNRGLVFMLMTTEIKIEGGKMQNALPYSLCWSGISIYLLKVFCWLVATLKRKCLFFFVIWWWSLPNAGVLWKVKDWFYFLFLFSFLLLPSPSRTINNDNNKHRKNP